jgi:DNA mismatch repair protein MutL
MPQIELLSQETIDKIAAGEVIERPSSVVKELVENAIDAQATAITVEIKDGGCSLIRITDNGCGIPADQVELAFLRHSTSKIKHVEDLLCVSSLGFRGEALSSIAAVARVELITKTSDELSGIRYLIEGSKAVSKEEIGAPEGTTFLVKDLFFNTPARKKFLKTPQTEGTYISDVVERLALSHPEISFKFISNNQTKLHTSGNGKRKDLIYHIYGRDIASALLEVSYEGEFFKVSGYIGKPVVTRGNRNYENYFINGRYVKSSLLAKAIEEAYKSFMMQHQYPFTVLYFTFDQNTLDVNVHPTKMELRFDHNQEIYKQLYEALFATLSHRDLIPNVPVTEEQQKKVEHTYQEAIPEPFEQRRLNDLRKAVAKDSPYEVKYPERDRRSGHNSTGQSASKIPEKSQISAASTGNSEKSQISTANTGIPENTNSHHPGYIYVRKSSGGTTVQQTFENTVQHRSEETETDNGIVQTKNACTVREDFADFDFQQQKPQTEPEAAVTNEVAFIEEKPRQQENAKTEKAEQLTLASMSPDFMTEAAKKNHRIIGQLFKTYWLIEYEDKLYIIDQHAAHEKVLYERTMARLAEKEYTSQVLSPPLILSLDAKEVEALEKFRKPIEQLGYVVEHFGGREYMISGIPGNLFNLDMKDLFIEMLDDFSNFSGRETPELILEKVASMSCKAAVKGNMKMSMEEVESLIDELLTLENPYNCPHGRPTIISMSKYELEKKFKRIV